MAKQSVKDFQFKRQYVVASVVCEIPSIKKAIANAMKVRGLFGNIDAAAVAERGYSKAQYETALRCDLRNHVIHVAATAYMLGSETALSGDRVEDWPPWRREIAERLGK